MTGEPVKILGRNVVDKHTHYEASTHVRTRSATVVIPGYVAQEFAARYKEQITERDCEIRVEFIRNDQRLRECQNPFQAPGHLYATLRSLDEIVVLLKEQ